MLDIKFIEENSQLVQTNSLMRGSQADIDKVLSLHSDIKSAQLALETNQKLLNEASAKFSSSIAEERQAFIQQGAKLKEKISSQKESLKRLRAQLNAEMLQIPNLTSPDVPLGKNDADNVTIKTFLEPTKFDFASEDHMTIGKRLNLIDFQSGSKVAGSKFYFLKNEAVILELALIRYALDVAKQHGYTLLATPELAKDQVITASGFTPRGPESQIYSIKNTDLSLIGTSEITIGGLMADTLIQQADLPISISGLSNCFRTEAGSYGSESRGLYRVHQFTKVELYQFCLPDQSVQALEDILAIQEKYYQSLELPYRVLLMCQGDLSAPAYKKYDIEAWMPFRNGYGEVTSVSNCTDFQARRLNVRYKDPATKKSGFVHTLNGTAVATTRTLLALLENHQQADGSILIPEVLQAYTGFDVIE